MLYYTIILFQKIQIKKKYKERLLWINCYEPKLKAKKN